MLADRLFIGPVKAPRALLGLGLLLLFALPTQAVASGLPFKPGHYVGITSQKCTTTAASEGFCQAGEKLPISFTLTKSKVVGLKVLLIEECQENGLTALNYTMDYRRPSSLKPGAKQASFVARNEIIRHSAGLTTDTVIGYVKGTAAHGLLESLLAVNSNGQLASEEFGYCSARHLHWQASRG